MKKWTLLGVIFSLVVCSNASVYCHAAELNSEDVTVNQESEFEGGLSEQETSELIDEILNAPEESSLPEEEVAPEAPEEERKAQDEEESEDPIDLGESKIADDSSTPDIVFGNDNRTVVSNTTVSPYSAVVRLDFNENGTSMMGSGAMIGPNLVLTAGHCVYSTNTKTLHTNMRVSPGRKNSYYPYGTINAVKMEVFSGYINGNRYDDIGLIWLDYPIGQKTGWFSVTTSLSTSTKLSLTGYHGDLNYGNVMYETTGTVEQILSNGLIHHKLDMMGGASGSPMYNARNQIAAVNVAHYTNGSNNIAAQITAEKNNWINSRNSLNVSIYRLYNRSNGDHVYTSSPSEAVGLENAGWAYERVSWITSPTGSPVYRLYNPNTGEHFYTTSVGERNALSSAGWSYEQVSFYASGGTPVYRLYNPNANGCNHIFTKDVNERNILQSQGWNYEGVAFYVSE